MRVKEEDWHVRGIMLHHDICASGGSEHSLWRRCVQTLLLGLLWLCTPSLCWAIRPCVPGTRLYPNWGLTAIVLFVAVGLLSAVLSLRYAEDHAVLRKRVMVIGAGFGVTILSCGLGVLLYFYFMMTCFTV